MRSVIGLLACDCLTLYVNSTLLTPLLFLQSWMTSVPFQFLNGLGSCSNWTTPESSWLLAGDVCESWALVTSLLCGGHKPNWMAHIEDLPLQYGDPRHTACKFCQVEEQKKSRPTGMVLSGSRQDTTAAEEDKWGVTGILLSRSCLRPDPDENEHISPQLWRSACRSYINKQLLHHGQCSLSSITKEFYSGINSGYWKNFRTTTYILR